MMYQYKVSHSDGKNGEGKPDEEGERPQTQFITNIYNTFNANQIITAND